MRKVLIREQFYLLSVLPPLRFLCIANLHYSTRGTLDECVYCYLLKMRRALKEPVRFCLTMEDNTAQTTMAFKTEDSRFLFFDLFNFLAIEKSMVMSF